MAYTEIAAVSAIPINAQIEDIILFTTVITSGIPSNVKRSDGVTTETMINIGDEFRFNGTIWRRIGPDPIVTTPLRSATLADISEADTMILGGVHTDTPAGQTAEIWIKAVATIITISCANTIKHNV